MNAHELDAIPDSDVHVRTFEESQRWLQYICTVLQPRSHVAEARTRRLAVPWRFFAWRRSVRDWEAITRRMEAILDANDRWASSTHPTSRLS